MNAKQKFPIDSAVLKSHVTRYAFLGLAIAVFSIITASFLVSYQLIGEFSIQGFILAQKTNPVIWILDLTPFIFGYWGQAFTQGLMNRAVTLMGQTTQEYININTELESKLLHESYYDSLTNLPNPRMLSKQIRGAMEMLAGHGELIVVILRINDFNSINYNFGTFNANNVLKQFANKLNSIVINPEMVKDIMGINAAARIQSDEFSLIFPKVGEDYDVEELLNDLIKLLSVNFMVDGINISITVTAGVSIFPRDGKTEEVLMSHANIAAYHARKEGKPYVIYNTQMEDVTQNRIILSELKNAIENNELEIYYQPVLDLETQAIVGAEALVRFNHPQYGLLAAEKFIPLIEGTNLIRKLAYFMLTGTIKQLSEWYAAGHQIYVSVNLSLRDVTDTDLPDIIQELIQDINVPKELLKLEFTERACLTDQAVAKEVLEQLAALGVKLSIDDFCSGYSSFMYLVNYPINDIKIEKSLILKMSKDLRKDKIVEAILQLAKVLNLDVVADGICDEETFERLKEMGCRYGQGFLFSRAVSAHQFEKLLAAGTAPAQDAS